MSEITTINTGTSTNNIAISKDSISKTNTEEYETDEYKSSIEYTEHVDLWNSKCSEEARLNNGKVTTDNQTYEVSGSVTNMEEGIMSEDDYMYLLATVAYESSLDYDGMLALATTMLNRLESNEPNFAGQKSIEKVLSVGYWPWGKTCDFYLNYENGKPVLKSKQEIDASPRANYDKLLMAQEAINDALNGYRNLTKKTYYYGGNGVKNFFYDKY